LDEVVLDEVIVLEVLDEVIVVIDEEVVMAELQDEAIILVEVHEVIILEVLDEVIVVIDELLLLQEQNDHTLQEQNDRIHLELMVEHQDEAIIQLQEVILGHHLDDQIDLVLDHTLNQKMLEDLRHQLLLDERLVEDDILVTSMINIKLELKVNRDETVIEVLEVDLENQDKL
jgi:hypothetical protein